MRIHWSGRARLLVFAFHSGTAVAQGAGHVTYIPPTILLRIGYLVQCGAFAGYGLPIDRLECRHQFL